MAPTNHQSSYEPSPISAGVDGTGSASGVARRSSRNSLTDTAIHSLLQPRYPGTDRCLPVKGWYTVRLDQRQLRTPLGFPLVIPSEPLAYAIAAEWNCQVKDFIRPTQMPLMTLVSTAIDQTTAAATTYREQIFRYLQTDTVCYWVDPVEDRLLHRKQQLAWNDLHEWITQWTGGYRPAMATHHDEGDSTSWLTKGKCLPHPEPLQQACRNFVDSLDAWHLTVMYSMTAEAKSFWIALSLLENGRRHDNSTASVDTSSKSQQNWSWDVTKAMEAARVEEEFNIANWGLVEGGHDYDRLNCSVQLRAAVFVKDCLAMIDDAAIRV